MATMALVSQEDESKLPRRELFFALRPLSTFVDTPVVSETA